MLTVIGRYKAMMKQEFEERIGGEGRQSDYAIIEHVYTWHPAISNTEGKEQIATLYKMGGMCLIKDMEPTAKLMEELDAEKFEAENKLKEIRKKIEDVVCGRTEREE